ncbi:MAG: ribosome maturation factor RimM [Gammaproteobacteria bacterium]|nr:ribosome maturation factor RimM [Gammaproteobacteria bacterium]
MTDFILVGRINGLFGTRGWVKVFSHTRPRDNLVDYSPWYLLTDGEWRAYEVIEARRHHGGVIAHLAGIDDRDQAASLVRRDVAITREQLGPAGHGDYYWADLVGLKVINRDGQELGTVTGLMETGAHDVMRIEGAREYLIPYVRDVYVLSVDVAGGEMRVDWHSDD